MNKKNYSIELWRFVFTIFVVMGHLESSTLLTGPTFRNGGMGVDFFFILSGFLLYQGYNKNWSREKSALGYTINLMRKRIVRFAPIYYICFLIGAYSHIWLYSMYTDKTALDILQFEKSLWPELVFLNSVFFHTDSANSATWYISALLIGTFILVLVLAITDKLNIKSWITMGFICSVAFYFHFWGQISENCFRLSRSLYGLALGGICWLCVSKIKQITLNRYMKILFSTLECMSIVGIIYCMFVYNGNFNIRLPLVLLYAILISISFLQESLVTKITNRKVFGFLGTVSYAIYVSHLQVLTKFGWLPGFNLLDDKVYSYAVIILTILLWGIFINYLPKIINKVYLWLKGLVHTEDTIKYIRYGEEK